MRSVITKVPSLLLAACLAAFAGAGFADAVPANERVIIAQSQDQDPGTPPDCKKYPKDVRCKDPKK